MGNEVKKLIKRTKNVQPSIKTNLPDLIGFSKVLKERSKEHHS